MLTSRPGPTPDIYHLVFDRYGSEVGLGGLPAIDNSDIVEWLEEQGFHVATESRANHFTTMPSLASTLSMSILHDLAAEMPGGSGDFGPLYKRIGTARSNNCSKVSDIAIPISALGSMGPVNSAIADSVLKMDDYRSFATALMERTILSIGFIPVSSKEELVRATIDVSARCARNGGD